MVWLHRANDMARLLAAKHVLGQESHAFAGADMSTKLKLIGRGCCFYW